MTSLLAVTGRRLRLRSSVDDAPRSLWQETDKWEQVLTSTGFLKKASMRDDTTIFAMIGRYGGINAVSVQFQKGEDDLGRAAFGPQYLSAKGA